MSKYDHEFNKQAYPAEALSTASMPTADCAAGGDRKVLESVVHASREWATGLAVNDRQRSMLMRIENLAGNLINSAGVSPLAMSNLRAWQCTNCRRLNAAQGHCSGRSLDRCPILTGAPL